MKDRALGRLAAGIALAGMAAVPVLANAAGETEDDVVIRVT